MRTLQVGLHVVSQEHTSLGGTGEWVIPNYLNPVWEGFYLDDKKIIFSGCSRTIGGAEGPIRPVRSWSGTWNVIVLFLWPLTSRVSYETLDTVNQKGEKEVPVIAFMPPPTEHDTNPDRTLSRICIGVKSHLYHLLPWPATLRNFELALQKVNL